jgi:hypothetical protein
MFFDSIATALVKLIVLSDALFNIIKILCNASDACIEHKFFFH